MAYHDAQQPWVWWGELVLAGGFHWGDTPVNVISIKNSLPAPGISSAPIEKQSISSLILLSCPAPLLPAVTHTSVASSLRFDIS